MFMANILTNYTLYRLSMSSVFGVRVSLKISHVFTKTSKDPLHFGQNKVCANAKHIRVKTVVLLSVQISSILRI